MPVPTKCFLNKKVPMSIGQWFWPFYRGASVQRVEIDQTGKSYKQFADLGGIVEINIEHKTPGTISGKTTFDIKNVRLHSVTQTTDRRVVLEMSDCRDDLGDFICALDYNIKVGENYLSNTLFLNFEDGLKRLQETAIALAEKYGDGAFKNIPPNAFIQDNLPLGGTNLGAAIDRLGDKAGVDMVVSRKGKILFASREDVSISKLPSKTAYNWRYLKVPGWIFNKRKVNRLPKKYRVYYWEKHNLLVKNEDQGRTVASSNDPLTIKLEQVYQYGKKFLTLAELLEAFGFKKTQLTDGEIAINIMTQNFEYSQLKLDGTTDREDVVKIIKNDWRKLWRVKFNAALGGRPAWDEIDFGLQNAEGEVTGTTVRCQWTLVKRELTEPISGVDDLIDREMSIPHYMSGEILEDGTVRTGLPSSPFVPQWVSEQESVLRLTVNEEFKDEQIFPGVFNEQIKLQWTSAMSKEQAAKLPTETFDPMLIEFTDVTLARFTETFEIEIFIHAKRRAPNGYQRWQMREIDGFSEGDRAFTELEIGEDLFAIRDYVDDNDPRQNAVGDGFGKILNADVLQDDAEIRVEVKKLNDNPAFAGSGEAQGTALLAKQDISGSIQSMALRIDNLVVYSSINAGNLSNNSERLRVARQRMNLRKREIQGVVIA